MQFVIVGILKCALFGAQFKYTPIYNKIKIFRGKFAPVFIQNLFVMRCIYGKFDTKTAMLKPERL